MDVERLAQFYRDRAEREARRAQPGLSAAEFMATIQYTGDVDRLTPDQRVRYMRLMTGDPNWGRRGYGS